MSWFSKRPSEEALKHRARDEYNQKDYKNAEKSLQKLREVAADKTWANDVLARLYMNTSRHMKQLYGKTISVAVRTNIENYST